MRLRHLFLIALLQGWTPILQPQEARLLTPTVCTRVKDVLWDDSTRPPIVISPTGNKVAYLIKTNDLKTDDLLIGLYVRNIGAPANERSSLIFSGSHISQIHWMSDGRHISFLGRISKHTAVLSIDSMTGKTEVLARAVSDIVEYSIDSDGHTVVYATEDPQGNRQSLMEPSPAGSGAYFVPVEMPQDLPYKRRSVFIRKRSASGQWTTAPLTLKSPLSGKEVHSFPYYNNLSLSLSGDGRSVLLRYGDTMEILPSRWESSPSVRTLKRNGLPGIFVLTLYDLKSRVATIPLQTIGASSVPTWSPDSRSFAVVAQSPVGSQWENRDHASGNTASQHLFSVGVASGRVEEIMSSNLSNNYDQPLIWTRDQRILFRVSRTELGWFSHRGGKWERTSSFAIPLPDISSDARLASNGSWVFGAYQSTLVAPELFRYDVSKGSLAILDPINPEFTKVAFPVYQRVNWRTSSGYPATGILLLPPGFVPGKRYPLVIQTHAYEGGFACGSPDPSYAPLPLASAGILYLMRTYPSNFSLAEEVSYYPKGYPGLQGYGGLQEVAFEMDLWESAVKQLVADGLVDEKKLGIIGFSRKGWYVEYILAHSTIHFAAASVADNIHYSMGEYWLYRSPAYARAFDSLYGGPPYGPTLTNWLKYSISFNLDKIQTPLLMEEMGYGHAYEDEQYPPVPLSKSLEVFTGLTRLHKPVALYYYPDGDHQSQRPRARLANIQRNVDWFRFWLTDNLGDEIANNPDYVRWQRLRILAQR